MTHCSKNHYRISSTLLIGEMVDVANNRMTAVVFGIVQELENVSSDPSPY